MTTIPMPPLALRQSVGIEDEKFFDNPWAMHAFGDEVPHSAYRRVLDFGCGCGRVARQMLLQSADLPDRYLGVDLFKPSIDWCTDNLARAGFGFRHMDVFNAQLNPEGKVQVALPTDEKVQPSQCAFGLYAYHRTKSRVLFQRMYSCA
jgi:hypothetical protein